MPNYSKNDVVLVRFPFSDLSAAKVRPAIVFQTPHVSQDIIIVPLTSRAASLQPGEFLLADWSQAGLNVATAVKRGVYTLHRSLFIKTVGRLSQNDARQAENSVRAWLGLA